MSTPRFPYRLPLSKTPPARGERDKDGFATPAYVLAWISSPWKFYASLGPDVGMRNFDTAVKENWAPASKIAHHYPPLPTYMNGDFYLCSLFNRPDSSHQQRVLDVANDDIINSARVAMRVAQQDDVEETLQWLRWPPDWVEQEYRTRLLKEYRDKVASGEISPNEL
ncbi:hypothetical protein FB45DRAFT_917802 [Roridomyces roridus]|uniref:Uncharacterized protein n=1 Tax=Roridomyces roridus TaxID=1738132 RepID=A0AAD7BUZ5_9AGAR|nr:hypothetical protein FB45DRAFT_917802 [Roridomyces roridus]